MKKLKSKTSNNKPKINGIMGRHDKKTYRELKREAVIRGMPFIDVVEGDLYRLTSFIDSSNNKPDVSLVDKFDDWVDNQLTLCGYTSDAALRSPRLRLGFIGEKDEEGNVKSLKRVKGLAKPKKEKRTRDTNGLYGGTKKSLTYEMAGKGLTLERTIRRVLRKFPDASEKSINIWYRAANRKSK